MLRKERKTQTKQLTARCSHSQMTETAMKKMKKKENIFVFGFCIRFLTVEKKVLFMFMYCKIEKAKWKWHTKEYDREICDGRARRYG